MGKITDITYEYLRIYGMFQDITFKDRKIHEMGLAVPGNRKFYFKPSYSMTSAGIETTHVIKEGDVISDRILGDTSVDYGANIGQWRVVKIIKQWYEPGTEIYRVAIVKNINLDGSQ